MTLDPTQSISACTRLIAALALAVALLAVTVGTAGALPAPGSSATEAHMDVIRKGGYRIRLSGNGDLTVFKGTASTRYGDRRPKLRPRRVQADLLEYGGFDVRFHPKGKFHKLPLPRHCHGEPSLEQRGTWKGSIAFHGEDDYVTLERSKVRGSLVKPGDYRCGTDAKSVKTVRLVSTRRDDGGLTEFQALGPKSGEKASYLAFNTNTPRRLVVERTVAARAPAASFSHDAGLEHAEVAPGGRFSGTGVYSAANRARRTHGSFTGLSASFLGDPDGSLDGDATLDQHKTDGPGGRHAFSRG